MEKASFLEALGPKIELESGKKGGLEKEAPKTLKNSKKEPKRGTPKSSIWGPPIRAGHPRGGLGPLGCSRLPPDPKMFPKWTPKGQKS